MTYAELKTMTEAEIEQYIQRQQAVVNQARERLNRESYDLWLAQDEYLERSRQPKATK